MSKLDTCFNLRDFRALARNRLPRMIFDYLDGGADDEVTLGRNQSHFSKIQMMPHALRDVGTIDLSTTVLGQKVDLPVLIAPTGQTRMFHHSGEAAVARAAAKVGTIYSLSSLSSTSIEQTAAASDGPKWFQIYVWRDREVTREFMTRCRESGYHALCLTVDLPVHGNRERDLRNELAFPAKLTPKTLMDVLSHPRCWNLWQTSKAGCMRMAMPGLTNSTDKAGSGKWPAWLTSAGSSLTSINHKAQLSPPKP